MNDSFRNRIPMISDEALREYARNPLAYKIEAVDLALAELHRRGQAVAADDLQRIRRLLAERDSEPTRTRDRWHHRLLGAAPAQRRARVRVLTGAILVVGLGSAALLHLTAPPPAANPLGYEPLNTKKYRRDLELYGGKVNVLATEFMRGFDGLWHGQRLGTTVATLTVLVAGGFWFVASHATAAPGGATPEEPTP